LKNTSHSSFIARQVAAHVDRFRPLTVPELREEVVRRKLNKDGKKTQLLMRLAIWTRDEIVKSSPGEEEDDPQLDNNQDDKVTSASPEEEIDLAEDTDDSSDEDSASSEELELFEDENEDDDVDVEETNNGDTATNESVPSTDEIDEEEEECGSTKSSKVPSEPESLEPVLQSIFGHSKFREGQEWAIKRCLDQKKSILVAPTGFGKSLCYALPAALMDGVCVVVSPLISLIQVCAKFRDQS
jgi:hypothetical protein